MFVNQYDLHFSGYRITQQIKQAKPIKKVPCLVDEKSKEADKQAVKTLNDEIKASRQTYTASAKQLKQLELARMADGNKSRVFERKHKRRDPRLYGDLVAARKAFNNVHMEQSNLLHVIQERQSRMYLLNKKVNGQSAPSEGRLTDANLRHIVAEPTTIIQGIDPGIVTVASGVATSPASLFSAVNRFQAISDEAMVPHPRDKEHPFSLTVSKVNTAVMSNQDGKQREATNMSLKKIQRNRVKRRCRLKKYHQRKVVSDKALNRQPKGNFTVTFTGHWSGSGAYIKGHSCRNTKPYYKQLAASYHDSVVPVDEYKSTVTCSSCFGRTSKQPHIRAGKVTRIPGAVVCHNVLCPRRLTTRSTTINRDLNDAKNIALIGFSSLAAEDGLPLPPPIQTHTQPKQVSLFNTICFCGQVVLTLFISGSSCLPHFLPTRLMVREESPHKVATYSRPVGFLLQ
ncbi:hypothetical protein PS15p_210608 [Mucor circinelloides]